MRANQMRVGRIGIALLFCVLFAANAFAQNVQFTQGTVGSGLDNTIQIPLEAYPGRGGTSLPVTLYYSSRVWRLDNLTTLNYGSSYQSIAQAIYSQYATAGWKTSLDLPIVEWPKTTDTYYYSGGAECIPCGGFGGYRIRRVYLHMPDGSQHELRQDDVARHEAIQKVGTFYAVDGSRIRFDSTGEDAAGNVTGTIYLADGSFYKLNPSTDTYRAQFIDRNGNTLNYDASTRQWTDTITQPGATAERPTGVPLPEHPEALPASADGSRPFNYTVKGVDNADLTYTLIWKDLSYVLTPDPVTNETPQRLVVGSEYLPFPDQAPNTTTNAPHFQSQGLFNDDAPDEGAGAVVIGEKGKWAGQGQLFNPVVLAEVRLPNGLSYKFGYNIYGEINKITYPTGAFETYKYGELPSIGGNTPPYTQANRGVVEKQLSAKGDGSDLALWTYGSTGTVVTTTAPDCTVTETYRHNFPAPPHGNRALWAFGFEDARNGMIYDERVYAPGALTTPGQTCQQRGKGALLRRKLTEWAQTTNDVPQRPSAPPSGNNVEKAYRNPRPTKEVSIVLDTNDTNALAGTVTYGYDYNPNDAAARTKELTVGLDRTNVSQFDYYPVDQTIAQTGGINLTQSNPTITILPGTPLNSTETTYLPNLAYQNRNILALPISTIVKDGDGNIVAKTETSYDEPAYSPITYDGYSNIDYTSPGDAPRAMATTSKRYIDIAAGTFLVTHAQFDQFGNLRVLTNERGKQTLTEYSSDYNYNYPTQVTTPVPDPSGQHGSSAGLTSSMTYDLKTGLVLTSVDLNHQTTRFSYYKDQTHPDPLNRLRQISRPDGGWTRYDFSDDVNNLYSSTEVKQDDTHTLKTYQYLDAMGRPSRVFLSEGGGNYIVKDIKYDSMGRGCGASNPYRAQTLNSTVSASGCSPAANWTTSTYDPLGRVTQVKLPDGTNVQTVYEGIYTTLTDQAGKQRRQRVDASGRIIRVDEPYISTDPNVPGGLGTVTNPKQPTSYEYDGLGNLIHIAQNYDLLNGATGINTEVQHRYFKYDGLSRLIYERQVEQVAVFQTDELPGKNNQWSRKLVYDETIGSEHYEGLLTSHYDARKIRTQYTFDYLNRVKGITYSKDPNTPAVGYAETPTASYFYDNVRFTNDQDSRTVYNLGKLVEVQTGSLQNSPETSQAYNNLPATSQAYNYDLMGRVANSKQTVGANSYSLIYGYNVGGALISERYPSGRLIAFGYDGAARLNSVVGKASSPSCTPSPGVICPGPGFTEKSYASELAYNPQGMLSSLMFGNGAVQSYAYNARLQIQNITLTKGSNILQRYEYKYGEVQANRTVDEAKNNGQVGQIESFVGGQKVWQQQYQYDSLGRLSTTSERQGNNDQLSYQINYDYDQFGNRYLKESRNPITTYPMPHATVESGGIDKSTNRVTASLDSGVTYDKAGNALVDSKFTLKSYLYDANNRQQQVTLLGGSASTSSAAMSSDAGTGESIIVNNGAPPTTSVYDGLGQRVATITNNNINQVFVYDSMDKLVAEYGNAPVYGNYMLADTSGTHYVMADHQGSTRVVMDDQGLVMARHDYEPFGREIYSNIGLRGNQGYGAGDGVRQKYAGMETDEASELSHTLWRNYDSASGRWLSPDPYGGSMNIADPQSLNRYTYVGNDPLNQTDPLGLMAGADQGWSGFDGFGSSLGFDNPHFGGPGIIDNGMDGFPDRPQKQVITRTRIFVVNKKNEKGEVETEVRVTVVETITRDVNTFGQAIFGDSVNTTVNAQNTGNGGPLSQEQLETVKSVTKDIVEVSRQKGFDVTVALGIAAEESLLGAGSATGKNRDKPEKQSAVNPMQLSGTSGQDPTLNRRDNIAGSIDLFNRFLKQHRNNENRAIEGYAAGNPGADTRIKTQIANVRKGYFNEAVVYEGW